MGVEFFRNHNKQKFQKMRKMAQWMMIKDLSFHPSEPSSVVDGKIARFCKQTSE